MYIEGVLVVLVGMAVPDWAESERGSGSGLGRNGKQRGARSGLEIGTDGLTGNPLESLINPTYYCYT